MDTKTRSSTNDISRTSGKHSSLYYQQNTDFVKKYAFITDFILNIYIYIIYNFVIGVLCVNVTELTTLNTTS